MHAARLHVGIRFLSAGVIVSLSLHHHRLQSCTSPCGEEEEGPVPDSVQLTSSASSSMSAAAVLYHENLSLCVCVSYSRWI